jgi:major vault protein
MVYGPCRYYPSTKVKIIAQRKNICLDTNEGIYVRDIKTGEVKLVSG